MIDPFVILAPLVLLVVVALLRFIGCGPTVTHPTNPSVTLSPPGATLFAFGTVVFVAIVQFEKGTSGDLNLYWSVNDIPGGDATVGTVVPFTSVSGSSVLYQAPSSIPQAQFVTVKATSAANPVAFAIASVTLNP